jgi:sortase A
MSEIPFTTTSPQRNRSRRTVRRSRASSLLRRGLPRLLAFALMGLGALALIDAGVTLIWQEPFTALYAKFRQDHLNGALHAIERASPTPLERRTLATLPTERRRIAFLAGELERHARNGGAVGRIVIPRLGASYVIVKGTGTEELKSGPGIYANTGFPGASATTAIAGHRTTYLAPFRHIDSLHAGSRILLEMPYARFTYTVIAQEVVAPTNVGAAVDNVGYERLVLSACTPLFSAAKRLLVLARLSRTVPVGAARRLPGGVTALPIDTAASSVLKRREPRRPPSPGVLESLQPNVVSPIV